MILESWEGKKKDEKNYEKKVTKKNLSFFDNI